jgi:hypothetical protein
MFRTPARSNPGKQQVAKNGKFMAPVGGWDAVSSKAAMPKDRAIVLDNWFPRPDSVEVRRGHQPHAAKSTEEPVESLMPYHGHTTATSKLWAAIATEIYDVTSAGTLGSATVTTLTNARWQYANFTTSGGHFLFIVNGADSARHYNGSAWATPTITGLTSSTFINVHVHKSRLWFIVKDSMNAAYLPTSSISGAAVAFPLGAQFRKGGYLVAMGTLTIDGGSGPDDYAVFISSQGQCAVYQGTDPDAASTWSLVGVFDVSPPIGYRCFEKVGGDLALVCVDGILPLSKALTTDRGAFDKIAITANIDNAMNEAARLYKGNFGWQLCPYPKGTAAILNVPLSENDISHQYVMNTLTGAWCRYTGQNANCWATFLDTLYFGGNDGVIYEADTGALDYNTNITCDGQTAYVYMEKASTHWKMLQPLVTTDSDGRPSVGLSTDFKDNATLGTPGGIALAGARWDQSMWDQASFGTLEINTADWTVAPGLGRCASVHFRIVTGDDPAESAQWGVGEWGACSWGVAATNDVIVRVNAFNTTYETGSFL